MKALFHGSDLGALFAAVCRANQIEGYVVWSLAPQSTRSGYWSDPNPTWLNAWEHVVYSSKEGA